MANKSPPHVSSRIRRQMTGVMLATSHIPRMKVTCVFSGCCAAAVQRKIQSVQDFSGWMAIVPDILYTTTHDRWAASFVGGLDGIIWKINIEYRQYLKMGVLPLIEICRNCAPATFLSPASLKDILSPRGHPLTMIFFLLSSCCIRAGVSACQASCVNVLITDSAGRAIWIGRPLS